MPAVSVIMPVFNTASEYMREAVDSVISQTLTDWELLIIDDASSSEDTRTFLDSVEKLSPNIKLFRFDANQGISAARNCGLKHARGRFIAFLDSDDIAYPERFAIQTEYLEHHPECDCLASLVNVIGDDKVKGEMFHHFGDSTDIELFLLFRGSSFCTSTIMLKKQFLDQHNLRFDQKYVVAEDYAFWCDMLGKTKFYVLKEKLVSYRFHFQNTTHTMHKQMRELTIKLQAENIAKITHRHFSVDLCEMFLYGHPHSMMQLRKILIVISKLIAELEVEYPKDRVLEIFTPKIRNLFYHSKGFKKQLCLIKSPLGKLFNLPLYWQLYCLITRIF